MGPRLGEVRKINPKIIMVRVSGYGQVGPYRKRSGYDRIALGFSGYMYPTGFPDRFPVRPAFPTADYNTGTFAALATMFALYQRDMQGGEGQMIDLALYEPTFRITANMMPNFFRDGEIRERIGNRNPTFSPAGTFETKDGKYVQIAAGGVTSSNASRKRWACRNWRRTNAMPSAASALRGPTSSKRCSPTGLGNTILPKSINASPMQTCPLAASSPPKIFRKTRTTRRAKLGNRSR